MGIVGAVLAIAFYTCGRVQPLLQARDWAVRNLQGYGTQSVGRTILAMVLLPDTWAVAVRARRRRSDFVTARVPGPRGYPDFSRAGREDA